MPFNSESGKLAGSKSKRGQDANSTRVKHFLALAVENNEERFMEAINKLDGKDLVDAVLRMTEYCMPKLQRTTVEVKEDTIINVTIGGVKLE